MKKTTLLMLTLLMSVFAFAQEIQQIPQPGLKKQLTLKQQILNAKREGKQLNKETIAQFNVRKPATSQLAKMKKQHSLNIPVQKMGTATVKAAAKAPVLQLAGKAKNRRVAESQSYVYHFIQSFNGWTEIDADGDGYTWNLTSASSSVGPDGESGVATSASYQSGAGALTPDNYLVSPKMKLDGKITFWANGQDASWAAEHFGVAVSTASGTAAADFTTIQEWTMTSAPSITPTPLAKAGEFRSSRRVQGNWYQYEVDLSSYAGAEGYVAIRHFDCTDMFRLNVDDITLETSELLDPYDPSVEVLPEKVELPLGAEVNPYYTIDGTLAVYTSNGWANYTKKVKNINVAFVGTDVYLQGLAYWQQDSWVKGTLAENVITIPSGQYVGDGEYLNGMDNTGAWLASYTFTVDTEAGTITCNEYIGESESATTNSLYAYWMTPVFSVTAPPDPRVIPPTELVTEDWTFAGFFYDGQNDSPVEKTLKVGAIDKDVYVQGISYYIPEAWIKGTLSEDGNSITFASGQYYGVYNDEYDMWFAAADPNTGAYLESVTVAYDAENGTITWPEDVYLLENGDEASLSAYGFYFEIDAIIKGTAPEPIEAPVGLETTEWAFKSKSLTTDQETGEDVVEDYNLHVQVGFAGNDVYVAGLCEDLPEAWLKGTLNPETNKITFATGQHFGTEVFWMWEFDYYFAGYGLNGPEDVVMTYDADAKTMTMESPVLMLINAYWLLIDPNLILTEASLSEIPDVAVTPAQPEIVKSSFSGTYPSVSVDIPVEAADGSDILTDKLYYQYWTEINGVQAPLTLDPSEYTELTEPMTVIPYSFTDDWDIYNYRLYLNQDFSTWKKIGIQSIYRGGEAENKSEISWKTIANLSVDPEFDSSKGGIAIQTKALEGEKAKIAVYPDNGYKVAKVTARVGKTYIKVDEEEDEDGNIVYSVIVPPADVIVNAEFDVTPADFTVNVVPGDLTAQIEAATEGMIVRGLNIQMEAGEYTMTKPIEAGGDINIAGNGSVIDASGIVGGEDGSVSAPFIQLSTTPQVDFIEKFDGSGPTDYYGVAQVAIRDVTVKGLKNSIFWDNNTKYCVGEVLIENSYFQLATEAVQNEALISFQAGGAKEINIRNNTFAGNNAVAKYFIRYNNSARLDRYGYNTATDYMIMGYVNNTFVNLLIADGQWGNYSAISGQKYVAFNVEKNIWWNCGKQIIRRMCGGRMNGSNPQNFKNNTYFNEGVDESAGEVNYDQSGTILTSDPHFENLDELKLAVRNKTEQALNETGDWNRWGEWIVDVYDITIDIAEDANGTVKAPANAQEGELITLEVVPAEGYRLVEGSLEVFIGKSQIELGENNEFNMPAADVTVKAQFELIPTFAITVAEGIENGTVVADKQEAAEGDVVTLTITPAEGFELDYITVTGVNTNVAVPVENNKFTMPADAVNINAAFKATATGILAVELDKLENATIYTLQGVRVEKAQKGVFIVNGKKTVIK